MKNGLEKLIGIEKNGEVVEVVVVDVVAIVREVLLALDPEADCGEVAPVRAPVRVVVPVRVEVTCLGTTRLRLSGTTSSGDRNVNLGLRR